MKNSKSVFVYNLLTGEEQYYSCDPVMAVRSAYAHSNGLGTQFAVTLGQLDLPILKGKHTVSCGDWTARLYSN